MGQSVTAINTTILHPSQCLFLPNMVDIHIVSNFALVSLSLFLSA